MHVIRLFFFFFWFNVIIFTSFNLRITLFSHKNYTFRTTNIARNIIKLTLKNKQICTRTYDFLIKTLSMSFKLKTKKLLVEKKNFWTFFFFFFENQWSAFYSKKNPFHVGPVWSNLVHFDPIWSYSVHIGISSIYPDFRFHDSLRATNVCTWYKIPA